MNKKQLGITLLVVVALVGAWFGVKQLRHQQFVEAGAVTIQRSGSFELQMAPEQALPLFSGLGEELWIPIWKPTYLSGDGFETGTTFITQNHGATTYWLVSDYNTETGHAQYVRVTPGQNTGTVDIQVESNGREGSVINVTYQLTALSQKGNDDLNDGFSEAKYAEMMVQWRDMVNDSKTNIDAYFANQ